MERGVRITLQTELVGVSIAMVVVCCTAFSTVHIRSDVSSDYSIRRVTLCNKIEIPTNG